MPKMKTHSGAKKRLKLTSSGSKVKRGQQNKNHILNKKDRKRKRNLRQTAYVAKADEQNMRLLLQGNIRKK
ncbi:MAG: 50S ribosomal protein L35 [Firmicutes bacterium]|nr:50S ribosomal protein L35 [Bacillota bacterium]